MSTGSLERVTFRRMKDGTAEEYRMLEGLEHAYVAALPQRLAAALQRLDGSLEGYLVSRLTHSLQAATRAERDGADEEMIAAEIMRPYVRPQVTWIVAQHGIFQQYYYAHHTGGDRHAREALRDHKWFGSCADFCENWDQSSFDPDYPSETLDHFRPLLEDVFGGKK